MKRITLEALNDNSYDAVIVGAGFAGSVHAQKLAEAGKKILIVEKRQHIGGNCYTEDIEGIAVHKYGSHILHLNDEQVWTYLQRFCKFNEYTHKVVASTGEQVVTLPFTMLTFMQLFNVTTVEAAKNVINREISEWIAANHRCDEEFVPSNFEEQAIVLVGTTIYEKLIKHYTSKQWGRDPKTLPAEIIKRLPIRWNMDLTYFNNAKYQGIPQYGYTEIFNNMLTSNNIDILHEDFMLYKHKILKSMTSSGQFIFTGQIDELFDFSLGQLEYRSLEFEHKTLLSTDNYQGTAVVNFTDSNEFTRCTEHKWYYPNSQTSSTVITHERSVDYQYGVNEPYYPINDETNNNLHEQYAELFRNTYANGHLSGRLAQYKYYDMDKVIRLAIDSAEYMLMSKFN